MRILGISPLDKDSTVCLVEDGKVVYAIGEERLSRQKMHAGFPYLGLQDLLERHRLQPADIDKVVYAFLEPAAEERLMHSALEGHMRKQLGLGDGMPFPMLRHLPDPPAEDYRIPGLDPAQLQMRKGWLKENIYRLFATSPTLGKTLAAREFRAWVRTASADHRRYGAELDAGLRQYRLQDKLVRVNHHLSHAANAFYTSGMDEALIVTLDGYGSGLAGSVSIGRHGQIKMVHKLVYPSSLGEFYERVTSSLGFKPSRHEGKIVGLAAYADPDILYAVVREFFDVHDGDLFYRYPHNHFLTRHLAARYSKPVVAAAFQKVLEDVSAEYVGYYQKQTGIRNLVLSGGVAANVKANQRLFERCDFERVFIHPNMGDGGCGVGAALLLEARNGLKPYRLSDVYWGPEFTPSAIREALAREGLMPEQPEDLEKTVAELLASGNIVARFAGRMEYGPRALGNRSILYHAKDPSVNLWLNQQLRRTEFMPFAPATLYEHREACYHHIEGGEYAAEFMTLTFDCTTFMKQTCPAAVHVDGTARPQLVREDVNPAFHRILHHYHRLTGTPSIINTSFNMHEEPIVCTPHDAIRAFKLGHLPYLAIGPYLVTARPEL